ncbi:MAG TPA: response regulator [bacterium]|nr:response regulator [bacterium]
MARKKVLIIDDADTFREIMGDVLTERGVEVFMARDGIEGLEKIRSQKFDLVLLDLLIPRMTGFDVLKQIRKEKSPAMLPVLAVSGVYKKDEHVATLKELGADGYVSKSLTPEEIADRAMRVLEDAAPAAGEAEAALKAAARAPGGDREAAISKMQLFLELDQPHRDRLLEISRPVRFKRGQVIIREGDEGDKFYGLIAGKVRVEKRAPGGDQVVIAELGPGAGFGEIALVDRDVRSATCVAETDVEALELARSEFERALNADPELERKCLRALLKILTARLRDTDLSLTFSRSLLDRVTGPD